MPGTESNRVAGSVVILFEPARLRAGLTVEKQQQVKEENDLRGVSASYIQYLEQRVEAEEVCIDKRDSIAADVAGWVDKCRARESTDKRI